MASIGNAPSTSENEDKKSAWWQPALMMFGRMSVYVVGPVIVALFIGKWLDRKLESEPFGLLSVVGLAFMVSMFGLVREASREYKKFSYKENQEEMSKTNKNGTPNNNART